MTVYLYSNFDGETYEITRNISTDGSSIADAIRMSGLLEKRKPNDVVGCIYESKFMTVPQNCVIAARYSQHGYRQIATPRKFNQ